MVELLDCACLGAGLSRMAGLESLVFVGAPVVLVAIVCWWLVLWRGGAGWLTCVCGPPQLGSLNLLSLVTKGALESRCRRRAGRGDLVGLHGGRSFPQWLCSRVWCSLAHLW